MGTQSPFGSGSERSGVRVLIIDDDEGVREGVCRILQRDPELQCFMAVYGEPALRKAAELQPDVIVLDVKLPDLQGVACASEIRERSPESEIVFFSPDDSWGAVHKALDAGARGYVLVADAPRELRSAVHAARRHQTFLSTGLALSG